jgi:hypothetical protein
MHVPLQAVAAHAVSVALYTAAATSFVVLALGLALYYYWELTLFLLRCLHMYYTCTYMRTPIHIHMTTSFVVLALGLALLLLLGAYSPPPQVSACALSLICTYMCVRIYHIYTYHIRIVRMQTPLTDEHELPTVLAYVCVYAPNSTS